MANFFVRSLKPFTGTTLGSCFEKKVSSEKEIEFHSLKLQYLN